MCILTYTLHLNFDASQSMPLTLNGLVFWSPFLLCIIIPCQLELKALIGKHQDRNLGCCFYSLNKSSNCSIKVFNCILY